MKKRILFVLLAAAMLAVLSGCCLSHEWAAATCEAPKTCVKCEKTEGEALGHTWVDADCVTAKTCSVCAATEGAPLGHTWMDADCVTAKTCSVCTATEGEALGHQVAWAPSTEDFQKMVGTCDACGEEMVEDVDWEQAALTVVQGTWIGEKVTTNPATTFQQMEEGITFEIRPDGTASLDMIQQVFEFTWNYKTHNIPYESMQVAVLGYEFTHADGGVDNAGITYFFGRDVDTLFLYVGDTIIVFKR